MKALVHDGNGIITLTERPRPRIIEPTDAIVRVTLSSICTSDLHIIHGAVPRALPNTVLGHEFVGVVEEVGGDVRGFAPGDRVAVNVETFCGQCFFCKRGHVNNCEQGRLGVGLPHRRLPSGVHARAVGRTGPHAHPRPRDRRAGAASGRHPGDGLLRRGDRRDRAGRHGGRHRRGAGGAVRDGVRAALRRGAGGRARHRRRAACRGEARGGWPMSPSTPQAPTPQRRPKAPSWPCATSRRAAVPMR